MEVVSYIDHCFVVANMPKGLAKQKRMEGAIGSGLFETLDGSIHGLSGGCKGAGGQYLDLLCVSDFVAGVDDLLPGLLKFLDEVSKLQHLSFDEGVPQLLHGLVDDGLVGLSGCM